MEDFAKYLLIFGIFLPMVVVLWGAMFLMAYAMYKDIKDGKL